MLRPYSKIYAFPHRALEPLFNRTVVVEEKIDGSQISFGVRSLDNQLFIRSKGADIDIYNPPALFARAVASIVQIAPRLRRDYTYRGEYLQKPKHNVLTYSRVPQNHIIIFDIAQGGPQHDGEYYLRREEMQFEAELIGLEVVPQLGQFILHREWLAQLSSFLVNKSILGGSIEGVVVKPVGKDLVDPMGKLLIGKYVSSAFKESHRIEWNTPAPSPDIITQIVSAYATEARWRKGVQHLDEAGALSFEPKDIGPLVKEIPEDVREECEAEIRDRLWNWAWPQIRKRLTHGFPEWYKKFLIDRDQEGVL